MCFHKFEKLFWVNRISSFGCTDFDIKIKWWFYCMFFLFPEDSRSHSKAPSSARILKLSKVFSMDPMSWKGFCFTLFFCFQCHVCFFGFNESNGCLVSTLPQLNFACLFGVQSRYLGPLTSLSKVFKAHHM